MRWVRGGVVRESGRFLLELEVWRGVSACGCGVLSVVAERE